MLDNIVVLVLGDPYPKAAISFPKNWYDIRILPSNQYVLPILEKINKTIQMYEIINFFPSDLKSQSKTENFISAMLGNDIPIHINDCDKLRSDYPNIDKKYFVADPQSIPYSHIAIDNIKRELLNAGKAIELDLDKRVVNLTHVFKKWGKEEYLECQKKKGIHILEKELKRYMCIPYNIDILSLELLPDCIERIKINNKPGICYGDMVYSIEPMKLMGL